MSLFHGISIPASSSVSIKFTLKNFLPSISTPAASRSRFPISCFNSSSFPLLTSSISLFANIFLFTVPVSPPRVLFGLFEYSFLEDSKTSLPPAIAAWRAACAAASYAFVNSSTLPLHERMALPSFVYPDIISGNISAILFVISLYFLYSSVVKLILFPKSSTPLESLS